MDIRVKVPDVRFFSGNILVSSLVDIFYWRFTHVHNHHMSLVFTMSQLLWQMSFHLPVFVVIGWSGTCVQQDAGMLEWLCDVVMHDT